jgi:uncharacterized protein (TIGR03083 family)
MSTNDFLTTTSAHVHERIDEAHRRFAGLVADVDPDLAVGGWTVAQVAGHLVNVTNRYNDFAPSRLASDPRGVDVINDQELEPLVGADVADLLARLDEELERFRSAWGPGAGLPLDMPIPFHGGGKIDVQSALTNMMGELLIHGFDVAAAADRPWPIDEGDGALLVAFASQILPAYVRASNEEHLVLHIEVPGVEPWALEVDGRSATSRPPSGDDRPAVRLEGSAAAMALVFYGRIDAEEASQRGLRATAGWSSAGAALIPALFEAP